MADLMDEIGDDLRREQLATFWKQNGAWIIGGAVMAVVMTAALTFWRGHEFRQNVAETQALLSAIDAADAAALAGFAAGHDKDHAVIARFVAAGLHVQRGEGAEAVAIYSDIAGTSGIDRVWRDLAALRLVGQRLGLDDPAALRRELEPLASGKSAWRFSAMEMQALLYARENRMKEAAEVLGRISGDAAAPQDARTRAFTLRELYLGAVRDAS